MRACFTPLSPSTRSLKPQLAPLSVGIAGELAERRATLRA
jgi:hypothetical protein